MGKKKFELSVYITVEEKYIVEVEAYTKTEAKEIVREQLEEGTFYERHNAEPVDVSNEQFTIAKVTEKE